MEGQGESKIMASKRVSSYQAWAPGQVLKSTHNHYYPKYRSRPRGAPSEETERLKIQTPDVVSTRFKDAGQGIGATGQGTVFTFVYLNRFLYGWFAPRDGAQLSSRARWNMVLTHNCSQDPVPGFTVEPASDDLYVWIVGLYGAPDTIYEVDMSPRASLLLIGMGGGLGPRVVACGA